MRLAFAPYKILILFALLQCISNRQPLFPDKPTGAVAYPSREFVKNIPLQRITDEKSFYSTGGPCGLSALLKLHRKHQCRFATTVDANMNAALQFPPSLLAGPALPLRPRDRRSGMRRDGRHPPYLRRLTEKGRFGDHPLASLTGEEQAFLPVVQNNYAKAAQLVNEYVARDSFLFDDPDGPCPQANWMRVEGRTGRCFKSFDFSEFRINDSSFDGRPAPKSYGTWEEAERVCMGFGAHLAALHTISETRFAHMVLDKRPGACWIGLRRAQPQGRRRHEDPSNGWKWITSSQGVLEDSDPLEWTRDWQPVWDSISYGPHLCGVFTRKGIAARRCHPINSSRPGAEGRWRRNSPVEGEKKHPTGLSCFLCATATPGSRLSISSFARVAEDGNLDWQTGEYISKDSFQEYAYETGSSRSGSPRPRDERKGPRESRNGKSGWILRPQERLTKRETRNNSSRADAVEGQGYHPYETRAELHRIHMVRGDHGGDRGRFRREEPPDRSAYYIGLPTPVDGFPPRPSSAGVENDSGGLRLHPSAVKKGVVLKRATLDDNEEDHHERGRYSYTPYLTGFESSDRTEDEQEELGSHSDGSRDDFEAEAAWLARTSASMHDGKTYSEFLHRFMELQRRKKLQRDAEEPRAGDSPATMIENGREAEAPDHGLQRPSHFLNDRENAYAEEAASAESNEEENGSASPLALPPGQEMAAGSIQAAQIPATAEFLLASEGLDTSELLELTTGLLKKDAPDRLTENSTAQKRNERGKQRRFLLAIVCSCGVGTALAFAGLVFVCVRCHVSTSQNEEDGSSGANERKTSVEESNVASEIRGCATHCSLGKATVSVQGAGTDEGSSVTIHSLNASTSSLAPSLGRKSRKLRHPNPRLTAVKAREQAPDSTAVTPVGVDTSTSACATSQQRVRTPFECQPLRNVRHNTAHAEDYHCSGPCFEGSKTNYTVKSLPATRSGRRRSTFEGLFGSYRAQRGLNNYRRRVCREQNTSSVDPAQEYETQSAPNCSSTYQGDEMLAVAQAWKWESTAAGNRRILLPTSRVQYLRIDPTMYTSELRLQPQEQRDSAGRDEASVFRIPLGENCARACLIEGVYGVAPLVHTVSPSARTFGTCQAFPARGLQSTSEQSETSSAASSEPSVSDISWKEHQTAGLHRWDEDAQGGGTAAEEGCFWSSARKAPEQIITHLGSPDEDKTRIPENIPKLTAMERLLKLRLQVGAL